MKKAVSLIEPRLLVRALAAGVTIAVGFMLVGHYRPQLALHYGLFGCMMLAGTMGLLYARDLARGYVAGALGGLVIGAGCGLAAVGTANLMGDRPDLFIPYGVMVCTLIGAIGGLFGQYGAWIRDFFKTRR